MLLHRRTVFLLYSLSVSTFLAAAQRPESSITSFTDLPGKLFFFDDTETAIYHNHAEGNVYVSSNEGKTWARADDIPNGDANIIVEHPFDNRYAFVLTTGKTHYRTDNRGKTWRKFELPIPPAKVSRPLSFHSDSKKYGYILYQGTVCESHGFGSKCRDETYYTKNAFEDSKLLLIDTSRCQFAHSRKEFKADVQSDLVFCVAYDATSAGHGHSLSSSRLFSSTDFFASENKIEDFGIGKRARGVVAFAIVSRFGVVALRDIASNNGEMLLFVTLDGKTWAQAHFPHASSARLKENAYTIVESTMWSLAVDVVLQDLGSIGTLFTSNSNGTFFVESLKDTNRNKFGYVDYERIYGVEGVGIANVVANAQDVEGRRADKQLKSYITFDDGSHWQLIRAPSKDSDGRSFSCDTSNTEDCSLHFHSITTPHNYGRVFSSPAPGIVMGVGSVGKTLRPYDESDTFLSTDAGVSWKMIAKDAHIYEFGDQGSILVAVNDEEGTHTVKYSLDLGDSWKEYELKVKLRARALITLPDSTSQKFLLLGQVSKKHQTSEIGKVVIVQLDFTGTRKRKCGDSDFEKWYARTGTSGCLMGHKQWYKRRKPNADCYVGEKFKDPVEHEEGCVCSEEDYECDYNFVRQGKECVPAGPEPIEPGVCKSPEQTYKGSSGFRKIPGNTCTGGKRLDEKVDKKCSQAQPKEGEVVHQTFEFEHQILHHAYFQQSTTILVRLADHSIWQSSNEGYSWQQLFAGKRFLTFYHHKYSRDRAYLITDTNTFYYTTDGGRSWHEQHAPTPPNSFGAQVLRFHPNSDNLIWTGNRDCQGRMEKCHAEAQFSRNNGRRWDFVEKYVRNCAWTRDKELEVDPTEIMCESYKDKKGSQLSFDDLGNPLELVVGTNYFAKKKKMFERVVGFAKFSEFLVVASMRPEKTALELQVSLDGYRFATGQFPPGMNPETHAYTVLESSTKALFLHMTMSESPAPYWGNLLKSNSNGTYFGLALQNVNRDDRGYVDFEKMIGLDGIALVNVVANPDEAKVSSRKDIQTRITHNDGSTWKPLTPPSADSLGRPYECNSVKCALHIHGYTERTDPRATYSSPSVPGLLMAVGNVGDKLAAYTDSDTFLSRDAGFTWQEVHKDAHLWEFGDSGSILVMVNDEEPTDHVLFSTDEGLHWREYTFTQRAMRVRNIVTVTTDTSRRFLLMGNYPRAPGSVVVHLDFTALTLKQCVLSVEDPGHDDFELWSPSEERSERCLFGRQTLYHRRKRDSNCVVGNQPKAEEKVVSKCPCAKVDFECEFNYVKNADDECVLVPGTTPLASTDEVCMKGEDYWYERTEYRLIPYSSCENGMRRDRGTRHPCPGLKNKSGWWWMIILMLPFGFAGVVGWYYYRKSGLARGRIRLPGGARNGNGYGAGAGGGFAEGNWVDTVASVPWFLVGIAGIAWEWVGSKLDGIGGLRSRRGYRDVPADEDAQILRFEDEE